MEINGALRNVGASPTTAYSSYRFFKKADERMKRTLRINPIGVALCFDSATTSRGEPRRDLMNSLSRMRSGPSRIRRTRVTAGRLGPQTLHPRCQARTRTMTAGQGKVSILEFEHSRCR